jgi:hypothetical protein
MLERFQSTKKAHYYEIKGKNLGGGAIITEPPGADTLIRREQALVDWMEGRRALASNPAVSAQHQEALAPERQDSALLDAMAAVANLVPGEDYAGYGHPAVLDELAKAYAQAHNGEAKDIETELRDRKAPTAQTWNMVRNALSGIPEGPYSEYVRDELAEMQAAI